jgi:putative N6-adenine-specific DNA methylase
MIESESFSEQEEQSAVSGGPEHSKETANSGKEFPMIAKTMAELEDVLAGELIALGANNVEIGTRMVSFTGDNALMYKSNVCCRTALRILKPIYTFKADNADEVYEALKLLNWDEYLALDNSFLIDSVVFSHIFTHSKFVAYRVKDAISDWFTEKYGKRPSVSVTNPDLVFNIHIAHNKCTLSLDSSGESLHKRGYRIAQTEAPLSEVLAAGMILKTGWHGESTFIDPMCGSGTLLIEAAMIALGIPPGIHRQHFAFEKWKDFDEKLFSEIYNDDSGARELRYRIIGCDISPKAIAIAEKNIKNAGLKKYIDLEVKPFQQFTEAPEPAGILMTNPPYGERIKVEDMDELYSMIGERLKHVFTGYNAYILSYRKEAFDAIGLRHSKRFFLYNGALECEMREYEIFSGKRDERPAREFSGKKTSRKDEYHYERNSREGYRRSKRTERGEDDRAQSGFGRKGKDNRTQSSSGFHREGERTQSGFGRKGEDERKQSGFGRKGEDGRTKRLEGKPFKPVNRSFGKERDSRLREHSSDVDRKSYGRSFDKEHDEFPRKKKDYKSGKVFKTDKRSSDMPHPGKKGEYSKRKDKPGA